MEIYICAQFVVFCFIILHYVLQSVIYFVSLSLERFISLSFFSLSLFKVYLEYKPNKAHIFILELIDLYWILNLL